MLVDIFQQPMPADAAACESPTTPAQQPPIVKRKREESQQPSEQHSEQPLLSTHCRKITSRGQPSSRLSIVLPSQDQPSNAAGLHSASLEP